MAARNKIIGTVLGTKDASPFQFFVGIHDPFYLQLDDLVLLKEEVSGETVEFYGVVSDVRKNFEGLSFHSENFLAVSGKIPARIAHTAEISVLRILPEKYIAPKPGNPVYQVLDPASVNLGYYFDQMTRKIPAGFFKNGLPAYLNYDFMNGRKGAHVAISGISGVATKTSYSSFLLYGLTQNAENRKNALKALIFNVKGEDLLFLDHANKKLLENPEVKEQYARLGLKAGGFENAGFYTSGIKTSDGSLIPSTRSRSDLGVYSYTLEEIFKKNLFPFFFSESDDTNIGFIIRQASHYMQNCYSRGDLPLDSLKSLDDVLDFFQKEETQKAAFKNQGSASIEAFLRRLAKISKQCKNLISPHTQKSNPVRWQDHQITVADIHNLSSPAQMFVVSCLIQEIYEEKEKTGSREPLVFVMLDELNKYAPKNGSSPIKDHLVDIAERGRSLGIFLMGAQQTASEVEKRVYANCALKVVGRLDAGEAGSPEYHYLPATAKKRSILLPQGEMILYQPDVPYPLVIQFPFPCWATCAEEAVKEKKENLNAGAQEALRHLL